jgi:putative endonuclease
MYFVYIIESESDGDYYKGITLDYQKRLIQHNQGESAFTRSKKPWKLVFVRKFETKQDALKEEKRLKRCNKKYLQWIITQKVNILNK